MTEYEYKGFKLCYQIEPHQRDKKLFGSFGYIVNTNAQEAILAKFHTDFNTKEGVLTEIRRLMEEYVDFEWNQYQEVTE